MAERIDPRAHDLDNYQPQHFRWQVENRIATLTLDRPAKRNAITFESYAELRDVFRMLTYAGGVKAVIITGSEGNFSSGGDVMEIIGPLTKMSMPELVTFTQMTGDVVRAMRACPQPIIASIEGICAGAGAILAMASDLRYGSTDCRVAFLFSRVGLAGCDMGACALLPRIIGQGRTAELLYSGRWLGAEEGERWGFFNAILPATRLLPETRAMAQKIVEGPTFAHGVTKAMLHREWAMDLDTAIAQEAQAQAVCMATGDFRRAYEAFAAKQAPKFEGN
jgi:enoyl-CoA hydratase/carnithine racemase